MTDLATTPAVLATTAEVAAGLEAATAWLTAHPEAAAEASFPANGRRLYVYCFHGADEYRARVRDLMDGAPLGSITKSGDDNYQDIVRSFGGGIEVMVYVDRGEVCERVVTGTETVEIPDPDAPKVTVERDLVEWRCTSILGGDQ